MKSNERSGFTLLELVISSTILVGVIGVAMLVQRSSMRLASTTSTSSMLRGKALDGLEVAASEMRWADSGSLVLTEETGSSRIDFSSPEEGAVGIPAWSTTVTLRVEPSGIDSNEDGNANEGRLVRIKDGRTRVLSQHVVPGGFSVVRTANTVTLSVSLAKVDSGSSHLLTADVTTSIHLRN